MSTWKNCSTVRRSRSAIRRARRCDSHLPPRTPSTCSARKDASSSRCPLPGSAPNRNLGQLRGPRLLSTPDRSAFRATGARRVIQLSGRRLNAKGQIVVRGIFNRMFPKDREFDLIGEKWSSDARLADLRVSQFLVQDGWIGMAVGPDAATGATTWPASRKNGMESPIQSASEVRVGVRPGTPSLPGRGRGRVGVQGISPRSQPPCPCPVPAARPIVPRGVSYALRFGRGPPRTVSVATMKDEQDTADREATESGREATSERPEIPVSRSTSWPAFAEMLTTGHDPYSAAPSPDAAREHFRRVGRR